MTTEQRLFIQNAAVSARMVGHPYPEMTACEAALESGYGHSLLASLYNNMFGMKAHRHPEYGTVTLPTREYLHGEWKVVNAPFVKYPTLDDCFADRLATLNRLASIYPHYRAALQAETPEDYVREVSKTWGTDPNRADKVILIYRQFIQDVVQPV